MVEFEIFQSQKICAYEFFMLERMLKVKVKQVFPVERRERKIRKVHVVKIIT